MNSRITPIIDAIQRGDLENAIISLADLLKVRNSRFYNEVVLQSSRLSHLSAEERKGIIDAYNARIERNKISNAIIDLIGEINKEWNETANKADILLVTTTKIETDAVLLAARKQQERDCTKLIIGNSTYYNLGTIHNANIFLVQSEMSSVGPAGSSLTILEGITQISPSSLIMVGIAFGVNPEKQSIGEVLVSKQLMSYALQRIGTDTDSGERIIIHRGDRSSSSIRLLDRFRSGELSWKGAKVEFGLILSGPILIDNIDYRKQLQELEPEAIGGEMEGSGLYDAANRSKVDWILVKAICDWADGNKHQHKSQRQIKAARNAANFTFHVLNQL
jgi:nucleoside phosphorylase